MKTTFHIILVLFTAVLLNSCATLNGYMGVGGYGGVVDMGTNIIGTVKRQFQMELIECTGSVSSQSVTAVVLITNMGPNDRQYIGGSSDNTLAIDGYGFISKPYNNAGVSCELPSGVPVRVAIERISPVRPGVSLFRLLRVSIGSGSKNSNVVEFRNVPIVWEN